MYIIPQNIKQILTDNLLILFIFKWKQKRNFNKSARLKYSRIIIIDEKRVAVSFMSKFFLYSGETKNKCF